MRILLLLCLLSASTAAFAADALQARRAEFRSALEQAERGPALSPAAKRALLDHPLYPYLEYAELLRDLRTVAGRDVRDALTRWADLPFAPALREAWLRELARRKDWTQFRALMQPTEDLDLRCAGLQARLAAGRDAALLDDIEAVWLNGRSLPDACDGPFAALAAAGRITPALRWQRILLAAEAGNTGLMRWLARGLPAAEQADAQHYAGFLDHPDRSAASWTGNPHSRQVVRLGLERLARHDTDAAEALLAALAAPIGLDAEARGRVQYQIALWSAASYEPKAARRLAAVPAAQYDARLHEWRVREALARNDHAAATQALAAMPEAQRNELRWRYVDARLHDLDGDGAAAKQRYTALATEPTYYGFLAADRLGAPYALCPIDVPDDHAARAAVAAMPGIERALELHALDHVLWATREWNAALPSLDDEQRRLAVAIALDAGWTDRAVFALANGDDQRVYTLRFPLAHAKTLRREAGKHGLDPAWVAALIRAESAWQPHARSHANARGLMQLLPQTGAAVARRFGRPWRGASSLFDPVTNIALGTAHLEELLAKYGGEVFVATAAYNAGPTPAARWLAERPTLPADLWIETIPYFETREYVARILAFSVIYDWRLGGHAVPISDRMHGRTGARLATRGFVCPLPATAAVDGDADAALDAAAQ